MTHGNIPQIDDTQVLRKKGKREEEKLIEKERCKGNFTEQGRRERNGEDNKRNIEKMRMVSVMTKEEREYQKKVGMRYTVQYKK